MYFSKDEEHSEPQEQVEEELEIFPISMSVAMPVFRLIFDGEEQDNDD